MITNDYGEGLSIHINQWIKVFHNRSAAQVFVLHTWKSSKLQATISFAGISFLWKEGYKKVENNACRRTKFNRSPNWTESRIWPNVPKFRSVDWTHDMIIVKWHLLIWHKGKLCALTNRPPAQSTQTGEWLSRLFHANRSAAQVFVLHPWKSSPL